jgi:hypothetical protein
VIAELPVNQIKYQVKNMGTASMRCMQEAYYVMQGKVAPEEKKKRVKFVQIVSVDDCLHALDFIGQVWTLNNGTWNSIESPELKVK